MDPSQIPIRDIHLPGAVSWWPLAPAWWLLALLLLALTVLTVYFYQRHKSQAGLRKLKSATVKLLQGIREQYLRDKDVHASVQQVSILLRRVNLHLQPRKQVASLSGEAWLLHLDAVLGGTDFSQGVGRCLLHGPYAESAVETDVLQLLNLCERWLVKSLIPGQFTKQRKLGREILHA